MQLPHRRQFLHLVGGVAALPAVSRLVFAQTYPSRPVRIIVGFPPGGAVDVVARIMGQWLSERFGTPFVVENRPGAGSNIAAEFVAKASPDGYTLLLISTANTVNATLYDKLTFNFIRDIAPVAGIVQTPLILEVHPSVPVRTVPEFIAYAKANPGKINMASGGNGSSPHVTGELFKMMTGVNMLHVPYRGGAPALTDLLGGQVQVMFDPLANSVDHVKAGNVRPLAVTTATRSPALPDIPTVGEFVAGFEASFWGGLGTPKNTPADVVEKLNREISAALANPSMQARLADFGGTSLIGSPAIFGKFIADETEKWAKVVKFSGARPD
jgi:tripartite-type tricarboxylate transporter receptor subunit TctC